MGEYYLFFFFGGIFVGGELIFFWGIFLFWDIFCSVFFFFVGEGLLFWGEYF